LLLNGYTPYRKTGFHHEETKSTKKLANRMLFCVLKACLNLVALPVAALPHTSNCTQIYCEMCAKPRLLLG
jgi:hypothetical protein